MGKGLASSLLGPIHTFKCNSVSDGLSVCQSTLCFCHRHPGNKKFRELVDAHKRTYLTSRFKQEKRMIADGIMAAIRSLNPPGRFLAKDVDGQWQPVAEPRAREKTLQALREKARSARAQVQAREPPRPSLPPEPPVRPTYQTITHPAPAPLLPARGPAPAHLNPSLAAYSASSGIPFPPSAQVNPAALAAALAPSPAAALAAAAGLGATDHQNYHGLAAAALSAGVPPAFLNSMTNNPITPSPIPIAAASPASVPTSMQASTPGTQASNAHEEATSPGQNSKTSASAMPLSPVSQSSNHTAPMAPPPRLGQGPGTISSEISTRLMSPQKSPQKTEDSLMPPPPGRPRTGTSPASSVTSASHTPLSQVQPGTALGGLSPFSSATFDALQRVAFPESPRIDQLFTTTRPFSPRRLPPAGSLMGLHPAAPAPLDPTVAISPHVFANTRRHLTPNPRDQSNTPQLSAQQVTYSLPEQQAYLMDPSLAAGPASPAAAQPQALSPFQQQPEQREAGFPIAYSPIPINRARDMDPDAPTPPMDSPFRRRLDMLRFLEDSGVTAPAPSLAPPRDIPLPRASLAPRSRRNAPPNQDPSPHQN